MGKNTQKIDANKKVVSCKLYMGTDVNERRYEIDVSGHKIQGLALRYQCWNKDKKPLREYQPKNLDAIEGYVAGYQIGETGDDAILLLPGEVRANIKKQLLADQPEIPPIEEFAGPVLYSKGKKEGFTPVTLLTILAVVVAEIVFVVGMFWRNNGPTVSQFILILCQFAFATSVMFGMLSFAKKAVLKIDWQFISLLVAGPPVIMLVLIGFFCRKEIISLIKPETPSKLVLPNGWIPYHDWKLCPEIGAAKQNYTPAREPFNLKNLLFFNYSPQHEYNKNKISKCQIDTYLFYFTDARVPSGQPGHRKYIKLQRFSGETSSTETKMFFTATSSFAAGTPKFTLFSLEGAKSPVGRTNFVDSKSPQSCDQWVTLGLSSNAKVDCMVVGYYSDGNDLDGDDFWIDVQKYVKQPTAVPITFGLFSEEELKKDGDGRLEFSMWKTKPYFIPRDELEESDDSEEDVYPSKPVPVVFRQFPAVCGPIDKLKEAQLVNWLALLSTYDKASDKKGNPSGLLDDIRSELSKATDGRINNFIDLYPSKSNFWKDKFIISQTFNSAGPVVFTYSWKQ